MICFSYPKPLLSNYKTLKLGFYASECRHVLIYLIYLLFMSYIGIYIRLGHDHILTVNGRTHVKVFLAGEHCKRSHRIGNIQFTVPWSKQIYSFTYVTKPIVNSICVWVCCSRNDDTIFLHIRWYKDTVSVYITTLQRGSQNICHSHRKKTPVLHWEQLHSEYCMNCFKTNFIYASLYIISVFPHLYFVKYQVNSLRFYSFSRILNAERTKLWCQYGLPW